MDSTDQGFGQVEESSGKVAGLIGEIKTASEEQNQGIDQINRAAGQMDKTIQQVAANAEESAASSEELSAQAELTNQTVRELAALIQGGRAGSRIQTVKPVKKPSNGGGRASLLRAVVKRPAKAQSIPLDEDGDFADF